jgi:hypothetical protein
MPPLLIRWRRALAELAILAAIGLFLGAIGPYDTENLPAWPRHLYWLICIVGGGLIGIAVDEGLELRIGSSWRRLLAVSMVMTPAVALLVQLTGHLLGSAPLGLRPWLGNLWNVFVIALPVMAVRALAWRRPAAIVETRTIVEPPLPEAEAVFRRRLSARRRSSRLIAVEAHDHYLRVHTDAGSELVTMRFVDALAELGGAHGFQIHRSWWVAADAIEAVKWRRGGGDVRLHGDLAAPVSRSFAPALKAAGWF